MDVGTGQSTGKTVAIILGGAAGVGFLVICLLFARGLMKKHDGMHLLHEIEYHLPPFHCLISLLFYKAEIV